MNDFVPDPLPDAKVWKRELFLQIDALINPPKSTPPGGESAWAMAWSYRYGTWGKQRPDLAAYVDLLVMVGMAFLLIELTSYSAYALKFQHWFRTKILRRPQLTLDSIEWEQMIYRIQAANQASLQHQEVYALKPFEGLKPWELLYGQGFYMFLVNCWIIWGVLLILYIVWFIIKYWSFLIGVIGGAFHILLRYNLKLAIFIILSLVPKFIRKFLRIKVKAPDFMQAFREIRNKHINWWILSKLLGYYQKLHIIKERTWGKWKRTLVEEPVRNIQRWYDRFKKVHVDLSYLDFLRIVVALHPIYSNNGETRAYIKEHGLNAANQRFFTTVSKALHYARKKKLRREKKESTRALPSQVPEWWRYLPVAGLYVLMFLLLATSVYLWVDSLGYAPVEWDRLLRMMAGRK